MWRGDRRDPNRQNALDILAQQIVAETSCEPWGEDGLYDLIRTAHPYSELERKDYEDVLTMLSDGIATSRGRAGALLHRDQVNRRLRGRRGAKLAAITSGGAIPESSAYAVIAEPEGKMVGTIDEDFAVESLTGDVFLLGTQSWRVRHVGQGKMRVEDAHGAQPSIPFWLGEAPGRSVELSAAVTRVRKSVNAGKASAWFPEAAARRGIAGRAAISGYRGGGTVLRRIGRDAAYPACAVRLAHQPGVGTGAAQAVLPHLQLRTAGGGDGQRDRDLAQRAACVSA